MKNKILLVIKVVVILGIFVLALMVRKKNYAEIPIPGQSVDEYSYSWVGLSLIENGMPVGISGIPGYKNTIVRYVNVDRFFQNVSTGEPLTINYPWMDHPPLLGLITGGYAYLSGVRVFEDTTTAIIRRPIVIIGSISVVLLIVYCWVNCGFLTAIVSGLLYATTPLVVLSARMIQAENAIIPCLLMCMIGISLYFKTKKDVWLVLTALVAGIATLFKLTGLVCHLFVLLAILGNNRDNVVKAGKDFGYFLLLSLPISFLFVVYGAVYGLTNFKNILLSNYNRFYGIGPNSLIELIRDQRLTQHKYLPEVSIISGWFVLIALLFRKRKIEGTRLVIFGIFSYLIVYIFFGSQPYGWYAFPFWPLLIILLSIVLAGGIKSGKNAVADFFLAILILGDNISRILGIFAFQKFANYWRVGTSGIFLVLVLVSIFRIKSLLLVRIILLLALIGIVYTNIRYLNSINLNYWWQNIS